MFLSTPFESTASPPRQPSKQKSESESCTDSIIMSLIPANTKRNSFFFFCHNLFWGRQNKSPIRKTDKASHLHKGNSDDDSIIWLLCLLLRQPLCYPLHPPHPSTLIPNSRLSQLSVQKDVAAELIGKCFSSAARVPGCKGATGAAHQPTLHGRFMVETFKPVNAWELAHKEL